MRFTRKQSRQVAVVMVIPTLVLVLSFALSTVSLSAAQSAPRCFPETGHFLQGSFRVFWDVNGGLPIFGYPITEEYRDTNGRTVQWFERARFEQVERNGAIVVELGLLGIEYTGGRDFPKATPIANTTDRRYIPETQHIIQYGFKTIWEQNGAERIFGYPISEEIDEQFPTGRWHTVQYFERVRFEYWPEFPPGQRVMITALGRALVPPERTAPVSPVQVPPSPQNPAPPSAPPQDSREGCDPSYPDVCIPPAPPDLDCGEIPYINFTVLPPDPHGFDRDQDGIGCEQTSTPQPAPQPTPIPAPPQDNRQGCDPSYPSVCIPPAPPDLDCGEIPYTNFTVLPPDPHRFDRDKDGIGCEK